MFSTQNELIMAEDQFKFMFSTQNQITSLKPARSLFFHSRRIYDAELVAGRRGVAGVETACYYLLAEQESGNGSAKGGEG